MGLQDPLKTCILDSSVEPLSTGSRNRPHFSTTMTNTFSTIFSRNNVMNALLALCTAIEFVYDMGERFGTWYRNGGDQQIRNAITMTIAAIIWTYETVRLGVAVVRRDGPQWISHANDFRNAIGRQFVYAA